MHVGLSDLDIYVFFILIIYRSELNIYTINFQANLGVKKNYKTARQCTRLV